MCVCVCLCVLLQISLWLLLAGIWECQCGSLRCTCYATWWGPGLQHAALRAHFVVHTACVSVCVRVCVCYIVLYLQACWPHLFLILIWFKFFFRFPCHPPRLLVWMSDVKAASPSKKARDRTRLLLFRGFERGRHSREVLLSVLATSHFSVEDAEHHSAFCSLRVAPD